MFKKINVSFSDIDVKTLRGELHFNLGSFFEYKIKNNEYLISVVKDKIKFNIRPDEANLTMIVPPGATPHKDFWPTALNIYVTAGNDVTYYWEQDVNESGEYKNGPSFYKKDMQPLGTFVANKGECYLLNTHMVHSVDISNKSGPRYILRFVWYKHSFDEVLNSIEIKQGTT